MILGYCDNDTVGKKYCILFFAFFALRCNTSDGKLPKIASVFSGSQSTTYFYDSLNRISHLSRSNGKKTSYIYSTQMALIQNPSSDDTLFLNVSGLCDSFVTHHFSFSTLVGKIIYDTQENALYYLSKKPNENNFDTLKNDYLNGNLSHSYSTDNAGEIVGDSLMSFGVNFFYDYYFDKSNTIGWENEGKFFYGRSSKNLIKREVGITVKGDTIHDKFYSYVFDNKERVITQVVKYNNEMLSDTFHYTYY